MDDGSDSGVLIGERMGRWLQISTEYLYGEWFLVKQSVLIDNCQRADGSIVSSSAIGVRPVHPQIPEVGVDQSILSSPLTQTFRALFTILTLWIPPPPQCEILNEIEFNMKCNVK